MAYLQIENLSFTYPAQTEEVPAPALLDVNFNVSEGEFVVLCGASGSGKSTLLRLLKPELAPKGSLTGNISLAGRGTEEYPAGAIAFVAQNPDQQIVTDKVWHELAFGLENAGSGQQEMRRKVAEMAASFGIDGWYHAETDTLSGGQKQMLNLAAVLVLHPKLLLLDEPTSQLDPIAATRLLQLLKQVNEEWGTTVILVEHRLEEAVPLCDRLVVLKSGRVLAEGRPDTLYQALAEEGLAESFPVAMQVAAALGERDRLPLTVREGRTWLQNRKDSRGSANSCDHEDRNVDQPTSQVQQTAPPQEKETDSASGTGAGSRQVLLTAREVWFTYERRLAPVIRDASLQLESGEIFAVLGGNGSGKSTLLSVLSGAKKPLKGKVKLQVNPVVLPQNPETLFLSDTVGEEYETFAEQVCSSRAEAEERVRWLLTLLPVEPFLGRNPYDLSGGEIGLCALGKVLLAKPTCLMLDEPTKGMDVTMKKLVGNLMRQLAAEGCGILLVTHDLTMAAEYADRCGLFFDGSLTAVEDTHAFFTGNYYYTTPANRLGRAIYPECITTAELILACRRDRL